MKSENLQEGAIDHQLNTEPYKKLGVTLNKRVNANTYTRGRAACFVNEHTLKSQDVENNV